METGGWGGLHYYAHSLFNALEAQPVEPTMLTSEGYELEDRPHPFRRIHFFRRENYLLTLRKLVALLRTRLADALIIHSEVNRDELLEWLPRLRAKTDVIPHGNYEEFRDLEDGKPEARRHLELPQDRQIILFFGAIRPYKGLDLMIDAVGGVRARCPRALFVVAGIASEKLQQGYRAQIEELGLGEDAIVTRFGYLSTEEAIAYVGAADLVVLPYRKIYQSGVLLWAYSGRPVVYERIREPD